MALIALCLWVIAAWLLMVTLTGRQTWVAAYGLIATGVPILIWLGLTMGWLWVGLGLAVTMLVLRWPVIRAVQWVWARIASRGGV